MYPLGLLRVIDIYTVLEHRILYCRAARNVKRVGSRCCYLAWIFVIKPPESGAGVGQQNMSDNLTISFPHMVSLYKIEII